MKQGRLQPKPLERKERTRNKSRKSKSTLHELDYAERDALDELLEAEETLYALQRKKDTPPDVIRDAQLDVEEARDALGDAAEQVSDKLTGYAKYIQHLSHLKKGAEYQRNAFSKRIGGITSTLEWMKDNLMAFLNQNGLNSLEVGEGLKIAKQKSAPTVLVEIPVEQLPPEYQRITIEADKNALREALQQGDEVDKVRIIQKEHVRIRTA